VFVLADQTQFSTVAQYCIMVVS